MCSAILRQTMFGDHVFDTVASISTIEHIGLDNQMLYTGDPRDAEADREGFVPAVKEFKRILKPGGPASSPCRSASATISLVSGVRSCHDRADHRGIRRASHHVDYFGYSRQGWSRQSAVALVDATVSNIHTARGRATTLRRRRAPWLAWQLTA